MTTIFLTRHGEDEDGAAKILNGRRNSKLTLKGINQSHKLAESLKLKGIKVVYTSPLRRSKETAFVIAKALGIKNIRVNRKLTERDYGILTGKSISDMKKYAEKWIIRGGAVFFTKAEQAESYNKLLARARAAYREISLASKGKRVLIVCHAAIGRMLKAAHYGWTWRQALRRPRFGNCELIQLRQKKGGSEKII